MPEPRAEQITRLLRDWNRGEKCAVDALAPLGYAELHGLAQSRKRHERPDHTLQARASIHEASMRLVDQRSEWKSRSHFLAIAAQTMRSMIVDNARAQRSRKRGAVAPMVPLDEPLTISANQPVDLVALNDALTELAKVDPQSNQIVNSNFCAASHEQRALGVSTATLQLQWAGARAWLYHELSRRRED